MDTPNKSVRICLNVLGDMVHSLSSDKGKMFLCVAYHAFTPQVNAWKILIGIVVQIQVRVVHVQAVYGNMA